MATCLTGTRPAGHWTATFIPPTLEHAHALPAPRHQVGLAHTYTVPWTSLLLAPCMAPGGRRAAFAVSAGYMNMCV